MSSGQILVAQHQGVSIIRLVGDVRLNLCISFDQFIGSMLSMDDFTSVVFDLREVEGVDSTTLGLMAKIAIGAGERGLEKPVVVSRDPGILRLLLSMGFDDIFELVSNSELAPTAMDPLSENTQDESRIKEKILEAHRILMELNQSNKVKFRELVETLENKGC